MSLGNDYLELINLMWEMEEINLWDPLNHLNLAYTLDKLSHTDIYEPTFIFWKALAKQKSFNELSWSITNKTYDFIFADERFTSEEKSKWHNLHNLCKTAYEKGCSDSLTVLGLGREKYAPAWFIPLFRSYMPLKEVERDNAIRAYCQQELGVSEEELDSTFGKISRWYDIHNEFYFFVKAGHFKNWRPILIQLQTEPKRVVTAKEICATTGWNALEAYLWMHSARENREEATQKLLTAETAK